MSVPTLDGQKKFFVLTDSGEIGPFAPTALNRMFSKGEVHGAQLCRREASAETRRLDEVFHHTGPSQTVVATARKNVAAYNVNDGAGSMRIGTIMFLGSTFYGFVESINVYAVAFFGVGISLMVNGYAQWKRGTAAQSAVQKGKKPNLREDAGSP